MPALHLLHQGARLRLRAGRLMLVDPDEQPLLSVPARKVRRVVVHGNVGFTTPALVYLLKNGATVSFVSTTGDLYGLASRMPLPSPDRIARQLAFEGSGPALELARAVVRAKLSSQLEYLRRLGMPSHRLEWGRNLLARLGRAEDLDRLRGLEGLGSRLYFRALARLHPELGFDGRRRRPPRDPVNAALSYAYTLLLGIATSALLSAGLHPEIGFLHATGRRRPSLALDLMEEFRVAVVDVPVLAAFRKGDLDRRDAEVLERGVYLGERSKRKLIEVFESRLKASPKGSPTYLERVYHQAERLAACILHGKDYRPFRYAGDRAGS